MIVYFIELNEFSDMIGLKSGNVKWSGSGFKDYADAIVETCDLIASVKVNYSTHSFTVNFNSEEDKLAFMLRYT